MPSENTAHHVFVDRDAERISHLLGARMAKPECSRLRVPPSLI